MLIGILQTGTTPEGLTDQVGDYDSLFVTMLEGEGFEFRTWKVLDGDMPQTVAAADGWLITGSRHGAYEAHSWIPPLEDFIRACHAARQPMVGVCFGHQIIAQALGGRVEKSDRGWGVGRMVYDWGRRGTVALNAWHQDQVTVLPDEVDVDVVATSDFCPYAALRYGAGMFTVQAHPEFGREAVAGLMEARRGVVPDDRLARAEAHLDAPTDRADIARDIADFFRAGAKAEARSAASQVAG